MDDMVGAEAGAVASPRKRLSPRVLRFLILGALLVIVAIAVWTVRYQMRGKYYEGTNDAYLRADSVTVSPKISGYVEQVFVGDNQAVKAGQPLVRIDLREYQAQAAQYQAQIDVARANADNVRAGIGEQEAGIVQARAQLATATSNARFAAEEAARYAPLAASGAETREKLSSLRNQATQAQNEVASARAALSSAERRIASLNAQVRQARAQGEAVKAQLAAADVNLRSTILRASVAGRVGDKSVRVGQFVTAGTRMMSIVPVQAIYVTANFKETQLGLMHPGQPATIRVDALPGIDIAGHVDSVSPGTGAQFSILPPQNATGNFTKIVQRVPVRIAIDASDAVRRILIPGMSVEATVDTFAAKDDLDRIRQSEDARRRPAR